MIPSLRTVAATRYVTPLREGGSLPAILEADDAGTYVVKFRSAAQGPPALVAELIAGELGRAIGLPVPQIVLVELDPVLGRSEPHAEIQALIRQSGGTNLGLDYLPGAITFDPAVHRADPELAAAIVWFDALITNVDRTPRNTNLLLWHGRLHLIDHGASLFFHYDWKGYVERSRSPFQPIRDHVLLRSAGDLAHADALLAPRVTAELIASLVALVPDAWLAGDTPADVLRARYIDYFARRLSAPRAFVEQAAHARAQLV